jgi:hypothetical protein
MLGAIEDDLKKLFALIPGGQTAAQKFGEFKQLIVTEAEKGAKLAIPEIKSEVERTATATIQPYVIASLGMGLAGLIISLAAYRKALK